MLEDRARYVKHSAQQSQLHGCQPGAGFPSDSLEHQKRSSSLYPPICTDIFLNRHLLVKSGLRLCWVLKRYSFFQLASNIWKYWHWSATTEIKQFPLLSSDILCFTQRGIVMTKIDKMVVLLGNSNNNEVSWGKRKYRMEHDKTIEFLWLKDKSITDTVKKENIQSINIKMQTGTCTFLQTFSYKNEAFPPKSSM